MTAITPNQMRALAKNLDGVKPSPAVWAYEADWARQASAALRAAADQLEAVPTREQTAVDEMGWLVFYSKVSRALIESPEVPTGMRPDLIAGEVPTIRDQVDIYDIARVVFALLQNGVDRD